MKQADQGQAAALDGSGLCVGIVRARFNDALTQALAQACRAELLALGVAEPDIRELLVPGALEVPLVLTPGDNDWSDAVQFKKIKVDPLERLQKLRATFYPREGTLGQRSLPVQSQARDPRYAAFVENLTWTVQGLRFATLHIVGSDDNAQTSREEHQTRQAAAIAWMQRAFASAKAEASPTGRIRGRRRGMRGPAVP